MNTKVNFFMENTIIQLILSDKVDQTSKIGILDPIQSIEIDLLISNMTRFARANSTDNRRFRSKLTKGSDSE